MEGRADAAPHSAAERA